MEPEHKKQQHIPASCAECCREMDCPSMNRPQKVLVCLVLIIFLCIMVSAATGDLYGVRETRRLLCTRSLAVHTGRVSGSADY
jgi:hypothetical protein